MNVMEAIQELRSPRGDLSIVLDAMELGEGIRPTIIVRHHGRTTVVGYEEALRRGIADDLLLTDDHLTWLRSQRKAVDEWMATWERLA